MELQYVTLINQTKSTDLNTNLIKLLCDKKITVEQLIEADKFRGNYF